MPDFEEKYQQHEALRQEREQSADAEIADRLRDFHAANAPQNGNITEGVIEVPLAERRSGAGDERRLTEKLRLAQIAKEYRDIVGDDPAFVRLSRTVRDYVAVDASATHDYDEEMRLLTQLNAQLAECQAQLDEEALDGSHDTLTDYAKQRFVSSLTVYAEAGTNGNPALHFSEKAEEREGNAYYVDGTKPYFAPKIELDFGKKGEEKRYGEKELNIKLQKENEAPLFPHEPCANDIAQGAIGDCYFVASLAEIADRRPDKIKEAMRDNGDGTVTVRFFSREKGENGDVFNPIYVKVDKVRPDYDGVDPYASDCQWVQTMERAFAASGLYAFTRGKDVLQARNDDAAGLYQKPVPENLEEVYNSHLKNGTVPDKKEYPWLVDDKGKLKPYQASYLAMEGGFGNFAMQSLLGAEYDPLCYNFGDDLENFYTFKRDDATNKVTRSYYEGGISRHMDDDLLLERHRDKSAEEFRKWRKNVDMANETVLLFADLYKKGMGRECRLLDVGGGNFCPDPDDEEALELLNTRDRFMSIPDLAYQGKNEYKTELNDTMRQMYAEQLEKEKRRFKSEEAKNMVQMLHDRYLDRAVTLNTRAGLGEPYSGNYSTLELDLLTRMQRCKAEGRMMLCGTCRHTDTSFGLCKPHEYTAIDTVQHTVNGKALWFVRLRNPHAQNIMEYKVENGTMTPRKAAEGHEGYFDIELGDFTRQFGSFVEGKAYQELKREKPPAVPLAAEQRGKAELLRREGVTLLAYDQALDSLQKALKETHSSLSRDSQEFRTMERTITEVRRKLTGQDGKPELKPLMRFIRESANEYLAHTRLAARSGSRRAERMELAESLIKLADFSVAGVSTPNAVLREEVAERSLNAMEAELRRYPSAKGQESLARLTDPNGRAAEKQRLLRSETFHDLCGGFVSLQRMLRMPEQKLAASMQKTASADRQRTAAVRVTEPHQLGGLGIQR